jgi:hypothetical protein
MPVILTTLTVPENHSFAADRHRGYPLGHWEADSLGSQDLELEKPMPRVLVAGDVVTDHCVYEGQQRPTGAMDSEGARWFTDVGGAGLVANLLRVAGTQSTTAAFSVDVGFAPTTPTTKGLSARDSFSVLQPCERQRGSDPKSKVWRVTHALGVSSGESRVESQAIPSTALDQRADVVILTDAGLGFRRWPNRHAWPKFLREPGQDLPEWVLLQMSAPLAAGDLWHTIVSNHTQPDGRAGTPPPVPLGPISARTVLILTIDDLRRESVRVDGKLSWERATADVLHALDTNARLQTLKKLRAVIIAFGLDGVLLIDRSDEQEPQYQLVFDPAGIEGAFLASVPRGSVSGYQTCLTAAIASQLVRSATDPLESTPSTELLLRAVRAGLSAMRRLVLDGHEPDEKADPPTSFPYARVARELNTPTTEWTFGTVRLPTDTMPSTAWTIVAGDRAQPAAPLWGLARRVALRGVGQLKGIPYLQFAKLFSVDRSEIESYRTLERLLTAYRHDPKASKPLSIAAFGPPGSGKSFGVKQLAEALFGDKNPLEFNLSQFTSATELHGLFHQIRDRVLRGQLPIVFWDEFDSRNLEWLQYLLAPMQDGTFQDGQVTHPIGRCVFVFAGGTRDRFEDFGEPPAPLRDAEDDRAVQKWNDDFKMKKGTDFKSRLAGYIDVLGPNPRNGADGPDITYPIRRALLLRVHLGLKPESPAALDGGLLEAFLRIPEYRHGARSMEKIAEQVRLSARAGTFTRSDLPPRQQIDLHVNAAEFFDILESV